MQVLLAEHHAGLTAKAGVGGALCIARSLVQMHLCGDTVCIAT